MQIDKDKIALLFKKRDYPFFVATLLPFLLLLAACGTSRRTVSASDNEIQAATGRLGISADSHNRHATLYREAASWLGTPYKYGGSDRNGTDCSGLTQNIYLSVYHISLARSAAKQAEISSETIDKDELQTGDLVFFATGSDPSIISHVGIYLKEGKFIHASSSRGVVVSRLEENYYSLRWKRGGRVKGK